MEFKRTLRSQLTLLEEISVTEGFEDLINNLKSHLRSALVTDCMDLVKWKQLCCRIEASFRKTVQNQVPTAIGAYYTTRPVANLICELTIPSYVKSQLRSFGVNVTIKGRRIVGLNSKISPKILNEIFPNIKILDNSLGLGEFLVATLNLLTPFYEQLLQIVEYNRLSNDTKRLRTIARSLIISNNLYGVDVCPISVKLASFRLWFLANQDELPRNRDVELNFSENLKQANALCAVENNSNSQSSNEKAASVSYHDDWYNLFPKIVKDTQGFDIIIGNPPYVKLDQVPDYKQSLKADSEIFYNQGDLTHHFILRSMQLLKPGGILGYIIARYFLEAKKADKIRNYLIKRSSLNYLLDLGPIRIFGPINTRSLIFIATKTPQEKMGNLIRCGKVYHWEGSVKGLVEILRNLLLREKSSFQDGIVTFLVDQVSDAFTGTRWMLVPRRFFRIMDKIKMRSAPLSDVCEIGKGMESGLNRAYTVSKTEAQELEVEVLKKRPRTKDIRRFLIRDPEDFFIFPSAINDPQDFPKAIRHLGKFKEQLASRHKKPKRWFDYSAPQNRDLFLKNEKILVPYTSVSNRFALDTENRIGMTDVYCITLKESSEECMQEVDGLDIRWILGILNSRVAEFCYLTFIAKRKKGEFEYLTTMGEIPIPNINLSNPKDRELHELTVKKVEEITIALEEWNRMVLEGLEVAELEESIFTLEKQLDALVYEQYGLGSEEQAIINSQFKCSDSISYFRLLDKFEPRMHIE